MSFATSSTVQSFGIDDHRGNVLSRVQSFPVGNHGDCVRVCDCVKEVRSQATHALHVESSVAFQSDDHVNEIEFAIAAPGQGTVENHGCCRTVNRSEEHTSELQSLRHLVCRLLLEK